MLFLKYSYICGNSPVILKKMNRFLYTILIALLSSFAVGQTRNALKKTFDAGDFVKAKPMAQKLLKASPKNSEYNYWYAACCMETGDTVEVREMLEFALSRKIVNAGHYLGDYCFAKEEYPRALEYYEEFLENTKDDSLRLVFSRKAALTGNLNRMVMNTSRICVVDSFVVAKDDFFSAYRLGSDVGTVTSCAVYFEDSSLPGHVNETERGMDIFFSDYGEYDDSFMKLYRNSKVADEWGTPAMLEGFDTYGNDDYPFLCSDGVTLYFASDGEGSIGGYDIFMTRMDTESGRFLRPDNIGMPFNSTANDYMLVIDEVSNLGWFVSDRNQPSGLVCVYVFVPNSGKDKYDADALGFDGMLPYAKLSSIEDTHCNEELLRKARLQLTMLLYADADNTDKADFVFVVDDTRDYTQLSDFKSAEARKLFVEWQERTGKLAADAASLEQMRDKYSSSNAAARSKMSASILKLEAAVEAEEAALGRMEVEIRRIEQEKIYK